MPRRPFHDASWASKSGPLCEWAHRWKRRCGAPGDATVKSSSGRLLLAVRALPRHATKISAWAPVSMTFFSLHPLLPSMAMVSGHVDHDQWAKLTNPTLWCSMMLLLDACLTPLVVLVLSIWWTIDSSSFTVNTLTDRGVASELCKFAQFS
jgi:hypothetical protein